MTRRRRRGIAALYGERCWDLFGLGCLFGDISGEELVLEIVALEACVEDSNSVVRVAAGELDTADVTAMEAVIVLVAAT